MLFSGIKKAFKNILEHKYTAASGIMTTSISMVLLGAVVLLYLNLTSLTQALFQQASYSVFISTDTDQTVREKIIQEVQKLPSVGRIEVVKSDQVRNELIESFGETGAVLNKIELPPFPDVIEFELDRLSLLSKAEIEKIRSIAGVEEVVSGRETKNQIETFFTISEFVGVFLIVLLIISIILMIHNSIQLAVRTRIKEIEILKILGATTYYIQIPFIVEGVIIALTGALIAFATVYFLYTFVIAGITFNESTYPIADSTSYFSLLQFLSILFFITLLGFISSVFATRKVLREIKA